MVCCNYCVDDSAASRSTSEAWNQEEVHYSYDNMMVWSHLSYYVGDRNFEK